MFIKVPFSNSISPGSIDKKWILSDLIFFPWILEKNIVERDVVRMRCFSYFSSYLWRRLLAIIVKEELTYWIHQFDVLSDLTVEFNFNLTIPSDEVDILSIFLVNKWELGLKRNRFSPYIYNSHTTYLN